MKDGGSKSASEKTGLLDRLAGTTFDIIDISLPISSSTACFPGDTPFTKKTTLTYRETKIVNLTALTMSPHVGTHADSPIHIYGDMESGDDMVGSMSLSPFVGPCVVLDIAKMQSGITPQDVQRLDNFQSAKRVLFRTVDQIRYDHFEDEYSYFTPELIEHLAGRGVVLAGIDTPSVDHVRSKDLPAHNVLHKKRMSWLENLDLTKVEEGAYFLFAAPLKFMELEASPVRALLLR